ncbi:hypothetical protein ACFQMB_15170 [Pseudobowmanella zhangzhouensis]|uniref:hypothetical protein n=1 Tax=Pseudobowmanella zhangzhouensis TaxID=1537679 RepID=UPI00361F64EE
MAHPYLRRQFGRIHRSRFDALRELRAPQPCDIEPDWNEDNRQSLAQFIGAVNKGQHASLCLVCQAEQALSFTLSEIAVHTEKTLMRVYTPLWLRQYHKQPDSNLQRLLADAEAYQQILYFDEADALFQVDGSLQWPRDFAKARCGLVFRCQWLPNQASQFDGLIQ